MKKFLGGFLVGILFTFASLMGYGFYQKTEYAMVRRCMKLYLSNGGEEYLSSQPQIVDMMKKEGFANIRDAVQNRCEFWIKNGQRF